jgi:hypothetical protein
MTHHLHVHRLEPNSWEWTDAFFEVLADNRVTRMVLIEQDGRATCNSVAIMRHRHAAYADIATDTEGPCVFGDFPAPDHYRDYWASRGCTFEPIPAGEFQKRFMRARPDLPASE